MSEDVDIIPGTAQNTVGADRNALGAVGESHSDNSHIFYVLRTGVNVLTLVLLKAKCLLATVGSHAFHRNFLAPGLRLHLLQIQHAGQGMNPVAHDRAAAKILPLAGHGRAGAHNGLFAGHHHDFGLLGPEDLRRLLHRSGINKVFRIEELLAAAVYRCPQLLQAALHFLPHFRLFYSLADVLRLPVSKISADRLFTNYIFPGIQGFDRKGDMKNRGQRKVDQFNFRIRTQLVKVGAYLLISIARPEFLRLLHIHVTDRL